MGDRECAHALPYLELDPTLDPCLPLREQVRRQVFTQQPPEDARETICAAFGLDGSTVEVTEIPCYPDALQVVRFLSPPTCGPEAEQWVKRVQIGGWVGVGLVIVVAVLVARWLVVRRG